MTALRRWMNRIDRWLDFASLKDVRLSASKLPGGAVPCLASHALERAAAVALKIDGSARLKRISAPRGTAADGAAQRWTVYFELPKRRAKLLCDWYLDGDTTAGRFGRECLDGRATPFPTPDSDLGRSLAEGRLAYGRLRKLWREERRRQPDLPLQFRDSDEALAELQSQGLRPAEAKFTLRSEAAAGRGTTWVAHSADRTFSCRFV